MNNSICERALRITCRDGTSTFQEFLHKQNSAPFLFFINLFLYHKNLQILVTEMFKTQIRLSSEILRKRFVPKTSLYNFRRNYIF